MKGFERGIREGMALYWKCSMFGILSDEYLIASIFFRDSARLFACGRSVALLSIHDVLSLSYQVNKKGCRVLSFDRVQKHKNFFITKLS